LLQYPGFTFSFSTLPDFIGASGGGQSAAAGASFEKNDFQKLLQILADYVKEF